MRVFSETSGLCPARLRGGSCLALALALLFAILSLSASALHHHTAGLGTAQFDCKTCSWTHSAGATLGATTAGIYPAVPVALPHGPTLLPCSRDFFALPLTRGPPRLSA
jgi:hypothetical protein